MYNVYVPSKKPTTYRSGITSDMPWSSGSVEIMEVSHTELTRAQFSHRIVLGQAVKQFISTSCHFHKELITSVHARAEV
jgi:hypothetical protein